jgi:hypothetical protein
MTAESTGFEAYVATLTRVRITGTDGDDNAHQTIRDAAAALAALSVVDADSLARLIQARPDFVPALGLAAGLSQEQLRRALQQRLGTSGWIKAAQERSGELIAALDGDFGLVGKVSAQRARTYTYGDLLVARAGTRRAAGEAQAGGRGVEDAIEAVVAGLGLGYQMRTRFTGRGGRTAPADFAVPSGATGAQVVCAAKGFDSTGSKLSDAVREIEEMAEVRLPSQYVFAVVDGIGWLGRRADLRRIYDLATERRIDGLYSLQMLDTFNTDLTAAARRLGLLT